MALRDLGADFERYKISEWEVSADASYNAIHNDSDFRNYGNGKPKEYLVRKLYKRGISTDGKTPMSYTEIKRKSYDWCLRVYNSFCQNQNLGSITKFKGSALRIVETNKYCYIMTYSFPCQDLSVAGKQAGMTKGSGTRSGLLWEVERLLNEVENLPQVLLMENVPQVHGKKNMDDFQKWIQFLESKGYSNSWADLNSRNYGVAQNRNRTFMVSILGNYRYEFPKPIELTKRMKDYLEDEVDEKYYINNEKAQKLIDTLIYNGTIPRAEQSRAEQSRAEQSRAEQSRLALTCQSMNQEDVKSQTASKQDTMQELATSKQMEPVLLKSQGCELEKFTDIANTLMARDYKGFGNQGMNGVIEWKQ